MKHFSKIKVFLGVAVTMIFGYALVTALFLVAVQGLLILLGKNFTEPSLKILALDFLAMGIIVALIKNRKFLKGLKELPGQIRRNY